MKKILIVVPSLKIGGGAEKIAALLSNKLVKNGYDVTILNFYECQNEHKTTAKKISLEENINGLKILKLYNRSKKITETCKKENINTVISFMESANFPTILSRYLGSQAKIIVSIRNNPFSSIFLFRVLIRLLYPKADKVVVITKKTKAIVEKFFNLNNVVLIYNATDIKKSLTLAKEKIPDKYEGIFTNNFVFINIGSLKPPKGQVHLLRAFMETQKKHPEARLIILGEGDLRKNLEKTIKNLGLERKVFLLGNQDNIYPFLKKSAVFVFSSISEGFANVIIEALSINIPIISTDCNTGPREILDNALKINEIIPYPYFGKYGILTKPFKSSKEEIMFSNIMIEVIENKKLIESYSKGLSQASKFDISKIICQWTDLIESL